MKVFKISDFKARCIGILKSVARKREPVIITLRGKALARVEPIQQEETRRVLGALRGSIRIHGDIVRSDFAEDWEASDP
jgi:prevent-host-death family protein